MQLLTGRVAVVTGAASGIGRATAIRLAQAGARVTACDLRVRAENDAMFESLGITQTPCDVRDLSQLRSVIDEAAASGGRLDILVNNAGVTLTKQVPEVTEEDWDQSSTRT